MSIKDYQLLSKLGTGSFGVVHKARDKKTNSIVVVKLIDISNLNAKARRTAMDEGKLMKEMASPFIVKHFATFIQKSTLYIVMEYCPKGDLSNYMKAQMGKPFKEETIWKLAIQMMIGLKDLHSKKILHRDMKTLNVFLDENYNVRIGDLGVAKTMTTDFAHTIVGTPYYLSPEMCQQKPYNEKTDIWAMGCIIYELCAGKRPFQANNPAALALKIVIGKFEKIPSHYSSDLSWIVNSCLSLDYKRRPTASYLLEMPTTKQWSTKIGISLQREKSQKQTPKVEKLRKLNQQSNLKKDQQKNHQKQVPSSRQSKSKEKSVEKIKFSQNDDKKNKQILKSKLANDSKEKKFSGAKRQEMKNKDIQDSQNKKNSQLPPKPKVDINNEQKGYASQKPEDKKNNEIKQKNMKTTMNKFVPENVKKCIEIEIEDEEREKEQTGQIPDSDSSTEEPVIKLGQKKERNMQMIKAAQEQIDDDFLEKEFGVSKKQETQKIQSFYLDKKPLSINWNQLGGESEKQSMIKSKREMLPTIRSGIKQNESLKEMKINEEEGEGIQEQINQNCPYISDEESDDDKHEQLLVEDFQQKEQNLCQKKKQNEKRKAQLQRMKDHLQSQLLKYITKKEYQKLKRRLTECNESQVEEFVTSWKNQTQCISLFYRIIHFDNEIKRCDQNLNAIQQKQAEIQKNKA